MTNLPEVTIGFQIQTLRVTSYSINEEHFAIGNEMVFGLQLQHLFNADKEGQVVRVELEMGHKPEQAMVTLHLECQYQLTGYQDWLETQPEEHQVPGTIPMGLATVLNSISISTARGVLFERLRGTTLHRIVLPIIDPSVFQIAG